MNSGLIKTIVNREMIYSKCSIWSRCHVMNLLTPSRAVANFVLFFWSRSSAVGTETDALGACNQVDLGV
jgi:hypothetical protein